MKTKIKVNGLSSLEKKLARLPKDLLLPIQHAVMDGALSVQKTAIDNINRGSRTGVIYKRGGKIGRRSAPGEYPKTDTSKLVRSIFINPVSGTNKLVYEVGSNLRIAKHAKYLEFGTKKMMPRPWLFRSLRKNLDHIIKTIKKNVKKGLQASI